MSKTFKTAKGTELPILNLKGKDYLEVKWRLVWFREEHPHWSIETEFVRIGDDFAISKATIKDEAGRTISTGQKHENKAGFPDYHEKAESGSIGRALGFLGYGTQFCADELDEGQRVVDSPVAPKVNAQTTTRKTEPEKKPSVPAVFQDDDFGDYQVKGGKFDKQKLKDIDPFELAGYVKWVKETWTKGKNLDPGNYGVYQEFIDHAEPFLMSREFNRERMP